MDLRTFLAVALAAGLAGCAGPQESFDRGVSYDRGGVQVVPAGRRISLSESYMTMDTKCRTKPGPTITFIDPPKHGRARMKVGGWSLPNFKTPSHRHCNSVPTRASLIEYTPAPGYRGPDALTARVRFRDGEVRIERFRIEVR